MRPEYIIGIDPGGTVGVVVYDVQRRRVIRHGGFSDPSLAWHMLKNDFGLTSSGALMQPAIEGVQSYGQPVGRTTFDTAQQVGWFSALFGLPPTGAHILYNPQVRMLLCPTLEAKDRTEAAVKAHLRNMHGGPEALLPERKEVEATFWKNGKLRKAAVLPRPEGRLYGLQGEHEWSALAVAVALGIQRGWLDPAAQGGIL